jgi:hypothetical protein
MSTNQNKYDVIIIGGGIAGLYSAYNILKVSPETKILVLERHKKQWIGGRIGNETFQGTTVVTGAGIGRKEKDKLLIKLLKELNVPYTEFQASHNYAKTISPPCDVKKVFNILKKQFKENPASKTFKEFSLPILGPELYENFIICSGYSDYENEDAADTFYSYGFDDNYSQWTALDIPWKKMIDAICKKIGYKNICTSSYVTKIDFLAHNNFVIHTENGKSYSCDKVILATTITSILKLIPGASKKDSIYQQIHGQTFLRLYGKFSKLSAEVMKQYVSGVTIVPGPLKKIIPIDSGKGVYMIAYTDNVDAIFLKNRLENTEKNRDYFCELLEYALGIPAGMLHLNSIKDFYWPIGTHYYGPLDSQFKTRKDFIKSAQKPMPGMLIVGEMISMNQGWTEGALESVNAVITKKWIDDNS